MKPDQITIERWMRSMPGELSFSADQIDAENGILRDVVMVQEGPAKGHGVSLEAEFVKDLVAYDNRKFKTTGVKGRFGHPGASDNTMGMQLGYFKNVREREVKGKMQAIADLHLLNSADLSPDKPNMRQWVIAMSQEAPDFIMSSIVFTPGPLYQRDTEGKKKYVPIKTDPDGFKYYAPDPELGEIYVEFGKKGEHHFTDLVEQGAATESLFSSEANPHFFVSQASAWLDEHPEIKSFAKANPDKVFAFFRALGIEPKPLKKMSLLKLLFGADKAEETTLSADQISDLRDKLNLADTSLTDATTKLAAAQSANTSLQAELDNTKSALSTAQSRIVELEAKAAAVHTNGTSETSEEPEKKSYHSSPANLRAQKIAESRQVKG
jgi:hypothetical protein